ncbi:MAG: hypothetical protein WCG95_01910 [bacterium]
MKKIMIFLFLIISGANASFCSESDYRQIYLDLQVPTFSYVHGIDPGQYYDNKNASYSTYPLFRLSSPLYFKTITIMSGYYALTPVTYKGESYLLFKDCGVVKYTVPVYKKEFVPEGFYESHLPKPRLNFKQQMTENFYGFLGKHVKNAQRKPAVKTYLEVNDLDNQLVSIIVYYGPYRYYTIFRTVQM